MAPGSAWRRRSSAEELSKAASEGSDVAGTAGGDPAARSARGRRRALNGTHGVYLRNASGIPRIGGVRPPGERPRHSARASATTTTCRAPALRSASEAASTVAPVVTTSSTSTRSRPATTGAATKAPATFPARLARSSRV